MEIEKKLSKYDIDFSDCPVNKSMLEQAEKVIGVHFGEELSQYLLKYGYLGFEFIEFYGMNSRQGLKSDLVEQTLYVHKYFPDTNSLIAIENQGEGDYYMIDSSDIVYEYDSELKQLRKTKDTFFKHIIKRFDSVSIR